jgi:hypothetical protein
MSEEEVRRDFQWAIDSPVLCGSLPPLFTRWARDGSPVQDCKELAAQRRVPIGRYFEALIVHWLRAQDGVTQLEANLPIRRGSSTLGEIDLLFGHEGRAYHWELALKFYLGTGDRLSTNQWFGPLGRDRLDLKLDKLATQLRLLETAEGKALLSERGEKAASGHSLVKGYLFHPYQAWQEQAWDTPAQVNPSHGKGWWIHLGEADQAISGPGQWVRLRKEQWLAPALAGPVMSSSELLSWLSKHFESDPRPPMVAALGAHGELQRGFVVPDDWEPEPHGAKG